MGSRTITNEALVSRILRSVVKDVSRRFPHKEIVVVSGGARGVDTLAVKIADSWGLRNLTICPDWRRFGKKAGVIGNSDIVAVCDSLLAFVNADSVGTWDTIRKAEKKGIPVQIVRVYSRMPTVG